MPKKNFWAWTTREENSKVAFVRWEIEGTENRFPQIEDGEEWGRCGCCIREVWILPGVEFFDESVDT